MLKTMFLYDFGSSGDYVKSSFRPVGPIHVRPFMIGQSLEQGPK